MPEDPEERQGHPLWGRQICSVLEQRKEHLETIIRREKREMRYSGQLHRKLPSELVYVAAAAAKSLQSCPTLCDPIDGSPPGSPVPGILQARTLEWVAIAFSSA